MQVLKRLSCHLQYITRGWYTSFRHSRLGIFTISFLFPSLHIFPCIPYYVWDIKRYFPHMIYQFPSSATFLEKEITPRFAQDWRKFWLTPFKRDKKLKSLYILAKADDSAFCGREIPVSLLLKIGNDELPQQNDSQVPPKPWRTSKSALQESGSPYPLLPAPLVLLKAVSVLVLDVHRVVLSHAGTFSLHGVKQGQCWDAQNGSLGFITHGGVGKKSWTAPRTVKYTAYSSLCSHPCS